MSPDKGRVALVTGAGQGIGRGIALQLAADGFLVVINDVVADPANTEAGAYEVKATIESRGGRAHVIRADIAEAAGRAAIIEEVAARFGRLDLLVNNAGIAPAERRDILEASQESFDALIATNLKGPYFLTQLAARWMLEQGAGRIVFVTSISAYTASLNRGEYCVSKAGLSMEVALYAARLAPHGIGVFEIRPGIVRTDMIAKVEKAYEERIAAGLLPQRRMGEGTDVARAVRAIADGLLDYCAGQVLDVDGGFHLRTL